MSGLPLIEHGRAVSQFEISAKKEYCSEDSASPEESCDGVLMSKRVFMHALFLGCEFLPLPFMVKE